MRNALCLLLLTLGLMSGCAVLEPQDDSVPALIKPPADAEEAVLIARDLARRGRWSAAIALLEEARLRYPQEPGLVDEQQALQERWVVERRSIEDQLMVGDVENLQRRIGLLEQLSRAEPNDLVVASRRIYWKEVLAGKVQQLTDCAETHAAAKPPLSQRCYEQAVMVGGGPDIELRLAAVHAQLHASEQAATERRRVRQARERQARAKVLLDEAKAAIDAHDYRRALDTLAQVETLQPDNAEVIGLKQEAWSMISPQVEALVKLGDHLYLDEQLEAAVATWKAALNLKPGDEELQARIDRAKTVLDRLDSLRQRQRARQEGGQAAVEPPAPAE
jgi:tetratricopeptide (TPR) repeat protein